LRGDAAARLEPAPALVIDPKLFGLLTALSFGIAPVFLKMAFRRGGGMTLGLLLGQLATLGVNLLLLAVIDPRFDELTPVAIVAFAVGGLAGTAVGRRWVYESVNLIGPARATSIRSSAPVITAIMALVFLREPITLDRWAAILAVVLGAALVSWTSDGGARGWLGRGVVYSLAAAFLYGIRPLIVKVGLDEANLPLAAALLGAVAALIYTLIFEDRKQLRTARLDAAFAWFLVSGLFQAVGITALTFGLSEGEVSVVYSIAASAPLFTLLFTGLVLRGVERITPHLVVGTILTILGVIYL
jgi:drug/metabolite transporter (DMT)-like permease